MELRDSIYLLFILLVHVMRGAGTFTLEEKMNMIKFVSYIVKNTNIPLLNTQNTSSCQSRECNHSTSSYISHSE